jgi:NAD(P)H-hydrate epimerase
MTRRQVRWVDQWATGTLGARAEILMENAGRCAAAAAEDLVRAVAEPRVAVLAGSGNNAGDGFVVARHLRIRNIAADVYLLGDRDKFSGEALMNLRLCERLLGPVREVRGRSAGDLAALWRPYDLLVDALGGTGITGALRGDLAAGVQAANATGLPILAIDIPTGMDCDTGAAPGPVIRARQTITFVARKLGFDAAGAAEFTGKVTVADIGIPVQDVPEPE